MSPTSSHEPPSEVDDPLDAESTKISRISRVSRVLGWAVALSALLHLAFVIQVLLFATVDPNETLDLEWLETNDSLTEIGHGMDRGTWAELKDESETEPEPESEPEVEEESEVEVEVEPEVEVEVEVEPEVEPEPEKVKKPENVVVAEKKPEKPVEKKPEKVKKPEKDVKKTAGTLAEGEKLPGLDKGGPSDLPDLKGYGPGNARFTALIRLDRLRKAAYANNLGALFLTVPDYRILLDSTDIDPMRDLDSIFMASANPRYLQETFLAVRHRMDDARLKEVLASRFADEVPWEKFGTYDIRALVPDTGRYKDPRQILLARPGLSIVTRPEWVKGLTEDNVGDSSVSLLDGLQQIERAVEGDDTLLVMSAQGLYFVLPGMGRVPRFEAARLAVTNPDKPLLTIDLRFTDAAQAQSFYDRCPTMKKQVIRGIPMAGFLGIAKLIERAECKLEDHYVTVRAEYTHREVSNLLNLALPFIPRPPELTGLPPAPAPPEPEVEVEAEAGSGAADGDVKRAPDVGGVE